MLFIVLGIIAGILSGVIGVGGGIIIIPALVYIFKFSQLQAQGTTLALLVPPIGILAAMTYYKHGHVDMKVAFLVAVGFVAGGLLGSNFSVNANTELVRRIFAISLLVVGTRMFFK